MALKYALALCGVAAAAAAATVVHDVADCQVLIAGGSLASFAAAITAANVTSSTVCYLEITDWPGGQMTASAVPAIDNDAQRGHPQDIPMSMRALLYGTSIMPGDTNPGLCWVSSKCFEPQMAMSQWILPTLASLPHLRTYFNTAVVASTRDAGSGRITSVTAVQRTPVAGTTGWEQLLSTTLPDWYSTSDSALFTKTVLNFSIGSTGVVIEATEFGDVLLTSGVGVGQGPETPLENSTQYEDGCGQATTIPLYVSYGTSLAPTPDPWPPGSAEGEPFSFGYQNWSMVWSYRRIRALNNNSLTHYSPGEISNQNWAGGNDLENAYLFLSLAESRAQVQAGAWAGGVNLTALSMAEQRAYGWYHWYKGQADPSVAPYLILNATQAGTGTGLPKMPYLRDTRRAGAGLSGYKLQYTDLATPDPDPSKKNRTAVRWPDTIAIGSYFYADVHKLDTAFCTLPPYLGGGAPVLPYYIPFRALTHADSPNLLVPGKSMAQSFWANAGTRLHPEEWGTGVAAGAAAVLMSSNGWSSADMLVNVGTLQALLQSPQVDSPLTWSL